MKFRHYILGLFALIVTATVAVAAATGTRLNVPLVLGQGLAGIQKIIFDNGEGALNPYIQNNGGDIQIADDTGNPITVPGAVAPDTFTINDGTQALTHKTLSGNTASSLINGSGTFNFNSSGTLTAPNATDTILGRATTDVVTNKDITSLTNSYRAASTSQDGAVTAGSQTFAGNKQFNGIVVIGSAGGNGGNVVYGCTVRTTTCNSCSTQDQSCNAGEILTGGGCGSNATLVRTSLPLSSTTWRCIFDSGGGNIQASAICCSY